MIALFLGAIMGRKRQSNEELLPPNMYKKGGCYYSVSRTNPRKWVRLGKDLVSAIEKHKNLIIYDSRFASLDEILKFPHVLYDGVLVALKSVIVQDEITKLYKRNLASSKSRSIQTDLSFKDIEDMFHRSNGRCEITGVQFVFKKDNTTWKCNPWAPTIDRINSKNPYSKENCRLVCHAANVALNEWGDYVFGLMCRGYANREAFLEKQKIM